MDPHNSLKQGLKINGTIELCYDVSSLVMLDVQVPIQTLKLSNIKPGKYLDRRPLGDSACCWHWVRNLYCLEATVKFLIRPQLEVELCSCLFIVERICSTTNKGGNGHLPSRCSYFTLMEKGNKKGLNSWQDLLPRE